MADAMDRPPPTPVRPALTPPRAAVRPVGGATVRSAPAGAVRASVLAMPRAPQQLPLFPPKRG